MHYPQVPGVFTTLEILRDSAIGAIAVFLFAWWAA